MSDIAVFLTATIDCGNTPHVKRSNPAERRRDYLIAFRHWLLANCDADIIFCENSAADLTDFRELAEQHPGTGAVQFLSFAGNTGAQEKGKGFGEIEMLRYGFDHLPEMSQYRYLLKVTGRYRLLNGVQLIERIRRSSADVLCDIHANLTYGDTKTVAFTPQVASTHLMPFQEELDEDGGVIIEHLMARCVHRTLLAGGSWAPLPCTPVCDGISGSWNTPQRDTWLYRAKQNLKRRIARWIYQY